MSNRSTSTVPRRQLGRSLRQLRERAGMTLRAAAGRFEWSETTMWRIETGRSPLRALDVQMVCGVYGANEATTSALMDLARQDKTPTWWQIMGDTLPLGFDVFAGLESAASQIDTYEGAVMPGLLQVPDYTRAVIRTGFPEATLDYIEVRVRLRMARQAILTGIRPPDYRAVLSETVLHRPIGGSAAMATQLAHVVYMAGLPNISIRVIPLSADNHVAALTGSFVAMHFPSLTGEAGEPTTVYCDAYVGGYYHDKEAEVTRYTAAFEAIWAAAQDEETSLRFLSDKARSYQGG